MDFEPMFATPETAISGLRCLFTEQCLRQKFGLEAEATQTAVSFFKFSDTPDCSGRSFNPLGSPLGLSGTKGMKPLPWKSSHPAIDCCRTSGGCLVLEARATSL